MDRKVVVAKIKPQIFMVLFAIALFMSGFRANINELTAEQIAKDIHGIGYKKSQAIVMERDKGGDFKDVNDFTIRVKPYGVGRIVGERVAKTYQIK